MEIEGVKRQFHLYFRNEIKKPKPGTIGTRIKDVLSGKKKIPEVSSLELGKIYERKITPTRIIKNNRTKRTHVKNKPSRSVQKQPRRKPSRYGRNHTRRKSLHKITKKRA